MSRRQAKFTQADVARAIRAAKKNGATDITVRPDGSIVIGLIASTVPAEADQPLAPGEDIVL
jgi:hypothetical protein